MAPSLDGSAPAPAEKWESYQGAIFRLRGRPMGYCQLFLGGRPAVRVFAAQSAKSPPDLQPRQWCSVGGRIYFCVEKTKLPGDYRLSYAMFRPASPSSTSSTSVSPI